MFAERPTTRVEATFDPIGSSGLLTTLILPVPTGRSRPDPETVEIGTGTMLLLLVWKGEHDDARMFSSSSEDGESWETEGQVEGLTSHGPAQAVGVHGSLHMAWKGRDNYARIFYRSALTHEKQVGGLTSHGPALAMGPGRRLYMAWKGRDNDALCFTVPAQTATSGQIKDKSEA